MGPALTIGIGSVIGVPVGLLSARIFYNLKQKQIRNNSLKGLVNPKETIIGDHLIPSYREFIDDGKKIDLSEIQALALQKGIKPAPKTIRKEDVIIEQPKQSKLNIKNIFYIILALVGLSLILIGNIISIGIGIIILLNLAILFYRKIRKKNKLKSFQEQKQIVKEHEKKVLEIKRKVKRPKLKKSTRRRSKK